MDPQGLVDSHPNFTLDSNVDQELTQKDRKEQLLLRLKNIADQKARLTSTPSAENSCAPSTPVADTPVSPDCEVEFVTACQTPLAKQIPAPRRSNRSRKSPRDMPAVSTPCPVIDVDDEITVGSVSHPVSSSFKSKASKSSNSSPRSSRRVSARTPKPRLPHGDGAGRGSDRSSPMPSCMSKCKRFQFCKKLTSTLLKDRRAAPFSAPVKELWSLEYIPDYFDIITHPMDLGTIRKNLETRQYIIPSKGEFLPFRFDVDKFANDIRLVFRNAIIYNKEGDYLHNDAHCLLEDFERTMKEQLPVSPQKEKCIEPVPTSKKRKVPLALPRQNKSVSARRRRRGKAVDTTILLDAIDTDTTSKLSTGRSRKSKSSQQQCSSGGLTELEVDVMSRDELKERLQYLKNCREAVQARSPIPKGEGYLSRAALLYDITISDSQVRKCVNAICEGRVPTEKMQALTELINQCKNEDGTPASATLDSATGEFETELNYLDNKSWRNVEAFLEEHVPKFKTVRSSTLGREFHSVSDVDSEIDMVNSKLVDLSTVEPQPQPQKRDERAKSFFSTRNESNASSSESSDSGSGSSDSSSEESSDDSGSDSD